jgi:hypothetical protein
MKLSALTEIWILDIKGTTHFHYPQTISKEKSGLLHKFLAGILKFMSELGGKEAYLFSLVQSTIIGLKLNNDNVSQDLNFFMVGAFVGDKTKKYLKQIRFLRKEIFENLGDSCEFEGKSAQLAQIIHKFL